MSLSCPASSHVHRVIPWLNCHRRYEKVGNILQTMLGALLCAVDMRLGVGGWTSRFLPGASVLMSFIAAIVFFLYRHFTLLQAREVSNEKDAIEEEKKELGKRLSEAKKAGASRYQIQDISTQLSRM